MPTEVRPLTPRQKQIYDFIRDKILTRGYGPTIREIGDHCGIRSPNGVVVHFKALEKKGFIKRKPNMSRALELTHNPIDELVQCCKQLLKDWSAGNIAVTAKVSEAKAATIAQNFKALRSQVQVIRKS